MKTFFSAPCVALDSTADPFIALNWLRTIYICVLNVYPVPVPVPCLWKIFEEMWTKRKHSPNGVVIASGPTVKPSFRSLLPPPSNWLSAAWTALWVVNIKYKIKIENNWYIVAAFKLNKVIWRRRRRAVPSRIRCDCISSAILVPLVLWCCKFVRAPCCTEALLFLMLMSQTAKPSCLADHTEISQLQREQKEWMNLTKSHVSSGFSVFRREFMSAMAAKGWKMDKLSSPQFFRSNTFCARKHPCTYINVGNDVFNSQAWITITTPTNRNTRADGMTSHHDTK